MEGILLIFQDNLEVTPVEALTPFIKHGSENFASIGTSEFNGYYNLLRIDDKKIIGLEFYPFDPDIGHILSGFDYVLSHFAESGDSELTIYFGNETDEVRNLTILQEWGKNYIYRSQSGTLAASFGVPLDDFEIKN
jgi:hypothetical protein